MGLLRPNNISKKNYLKLFKEAINTRIAIPPTTTELRFGVELEVEDISHKLTVADSNTLTLLGIETKTDGSLRNNGLEFVFNGPKDLDSTTAAVDELCRIVNARTPSFSDRTSLHVHMNASGMTVKDMHQFLTCWYLLEDLLVKRSGGTDREACFFCIRGSDSNGIIESIKTGFRGSVGRIITRERYCALNTNAFTRFGSLEVRSHRGTGEAEEIKKWIRALNEVCLVSKSFTSAPEIMELSSSFGARRFLQRYFPITYNYIQNAPDETTRVGDDFDTYYSDGLLLAQDIAYCVDVVEEEKDEEPIKKKRENLYHVLERLEDAGEMAHPTPTRPQTTAPDTAAVLAETSREIMARTAARRAAERAEMLRITAERQTLAAPVPSPAPVRAARPHLNLGNWAFL